MSKLSTKLSDAVASLKYGAKIRTANDGNPIDELTIHHEGFCFMVDIDVASGEPTGEFSWSHDPTMSHTPLREHYKTVKLTKKEGKELESKEVE